MPSFLVSFSFAPNVWCLFPVVQVYFMCVCVCHVSFQTFFGLCVCVCVCFDCEFAEYLSNCEHEQTITLPRNEASEILNSKIAKMSVLSIWRYLSAFPSLLCLFSFVVVSRIQVTFPPDASCVCVWVRKNINVSKCNLVCWSENVCTCIYKFVIAVWFIREHSE